MVPVLMLMAALCYTPAQAPGDGLSLEPGPPPRIAGRTTTPNTPGPPSGSAPLVPGGAVLAGAGIAGTVLLRRRRPPTSLQAVPADMVVVFVSGHGSGYADSFDPLIANLRLPPDQVLHFDYRMVVAATDHRRATQDATVQEVADGLAGYLAGIATHDHRRVYLVGFSKGGASIAELLAQWDEHPERRIPSVVGAALLDPPISGGRLGALQSAGLAWGPPPDDGGFEAVRCSWFGLRCHDRRAHLGQSAQVEVVVFRNPDAVFTNFSDRPEGLRVYDVDDPGRSAWVQLFLNPFRLPARIAEAHEYPKRSVAVAGCIRRELWAPGSCAGLGRASGGGMRR